MRRSAAPRGSADHPAAPGVSGAGLDIPAMTNDELRAKIANLRAARMARQAAKARPRKARRLGYTQHQIRPDVVKGGAGSVILKYFPMEGAAQLAVRASRGRSRCGMRKQPRRAPTQL